MAHYMIRRKFLLVLMMPVIFSLILVWALSFILKSIGAIILISMGSALILAIFFSYKLANKMMRPLQQMKESCRVIGQGEFGQEVLAGTRDEVGELAGAFNQMASNLEVRMKEISEDRIRLAAILSSMVEGVMVLDCRGTILMVNRALEDMFQISGRKAVGLSFLEVIRNHSLIELIKKLLDARASRSGEVVIQTPQETFFDVQASVATNCKDGEVCAVLVFHDVTETRRLERVRKDFVANVSHELKTPLTSIKGYIEALLDGARDDPGRCLEFLQILQRQTDRLNSLITDLLMLSQIESGQYTCKRDAVDMADVTKRAVAMLKPLVEIKQHQLTVMLHPELSPAIGDEGKLTQVMINLLDNAIKYTPDGGAIAIEAMQSGNNIEMTVSDTGIGIPKKDLPRIFERFYRVDRARSRELGGTGLGLSIVRHIVEAHNGGIQVQSEPGKGSKFTLFLPSKSA